MEALRGNAIHLANDFLYGVGRGVLPGLKIHALPSNSAVITCLANDEGYNSIFTEQLKALSNPGDLVLSFSGSGNSENIIEALRWSNGNKISTYAILGFDGGKAKKIAKHVIHTKINDMQISEDFQLIIGHLLMQWLSKKKADKMTLPKETLAAILVEQKKELVIGKISLPEKLDVGQVLVEYHFSGICGSQIGEIEGIKGVDNWLPHLLGHEASGTVLAIGPGVSRVEPGDKVVAHWRPAPGIQCPTPKYTWNGKIVNAGWVTTFNKFGIAAENRLTKVDPAVKNEEPVLFGCAITTGFGVIDNNARLKFGETVVVFGSGELGQPNSGGKFGWSLTNCCYR